MYPRFALRVVALQKPFDENRNFSDRKLPIFSVEGWAMIALMTSAKCSRDKDGEIHAYKKMPNSHFK